MSSVTMASSDIHMSSVDAPTGQLPPLGGRERRRASGPTRLPAPGRHLAIEERGEVLFVALDRPVLHIGRSPAADIVLDDATVSRKHAVIAQQDGETVVLDDRSRHGVLVNGERVLRAVLRSGDTIELGGVAVRYVEVGPPGPA
jgi:pSer/pThr/pTyr-binding forkhead associated (FHA) protein